jgi:hypothetical protein
MKEDGGRGGEGSMNGRKAKSMTRTLTPKVKKTRKIMNEMSEVIDEKVEAD